MVLKDMLEISTLILLVGVPILTWVVIFISEVNESIKKEGGKYSYWWSRLIASEWAAILAVFALCSGFFNLAVVVNVVRWDRPWMESVIEISPIVGWFIPGIVVFCVFTCLPSIIGKTITAFQKYKRGYYV